MAALGGKRWKCFDHSYDLIHTCLEQLSSGGGNLAQESPESYGLAGVKNQPVGDRKGGVVWHTQGSGKSLSMVFYTNKIVLALDNPTIVANDRNDLTTQLFESSCSIQQKLYAQESQCSRFEIN
ncbi:MAG: hypothetical protein IPH88_18670 [Bacteroidales bacterium]|nr:hypothetical protein [Bacteroidales bacterium]